MKLAISGTSKTPITLLISSTSWIFVAINKPKREEVEEEEEDEDDDKETEKKEETAM